jgi:UDPglucose 6-dehydrogenase
LDGTLERPTRDREPTLKIAVVGLWHLGTVTAACLAAAGHDITAIDEDADKIRELQSGIVPVAEPGLRDLVDQGLNTGHLRFTAEFSAARGHEIVWIAYDTPVKEDDSADTEFVFDRIVAILPHLPEGAILLVSSQMPVGSIARIEQRYHESGQQNHIEFAYSPENLRLGKAIEVFTRPDRVVVGVRSERARDRLAPLWAAFTENVLWMSIESAEMTKHALNAFLATSVAFMNEIATVCEQVGADAVEVEKGLKSDVRIGPRAYLHPGGAFAGGTLARDIQFLRDIARRSSLSLPLITGVKESNDSHRKWVRRKLETIFDDVGGRTIAVLGLTYKPGTDTLRRSSAVELCQWLAAQGATVQAYDPAVHALPDHLSSCVLLADSASKALREADAAVIATEWPEFNTLQSETFLSEMKTAVVIDPLRYVETTLGAVTGIRYFSIGCAHETQR